MELVFFIRGHSPEQQHAENDPGTESVRPALSKWMVWHPSYWSPARVILPSGSLEGTNPGARVSHPRGDEEEKIADGRAICYEPVGLVYPQQRLPCSPACNICAVALRD